MPTPVEIRALRRAHRIPAGDLYSVSGLADFTDRQAALPRIAAECSDIKNLLEQLPDFAVECGYGWAPDPESYDVLTDAAYQRRLLFMLGKYWIESPHKIGLAGRMSGIVATQDYVTRYGFFSGRLSASSTPTALRVLSIPASLIEMASWLFAGLRCWTARELGVERDVADDGGWSMVTTAAPGRCPRPYAHVSVFELVARTLAEKGRDLALHGSNAALLIREQVPELGGVGGDIDAFSLTHFDQNASYMVVEFTLAHELGHALSTMAKDDGDAGYAEAEADADHTACLLLAMTAPLRTFGWGEDHLGVWTQAALGLALFNIVVDGRMRLSRGLDRFRETPSADALIGQEQVRAAVARQGLDTLLARMKEGAEAGGAQRAAALLANADAFLGDLDEMVAGISDAAISRAIAIARESTGNASR